MTKDEAKLIVQTRKEAGDLFSPSHDVKLQQAWDVLAGKKVKCTECSSVLGVTDPCGPCQGM